MVLGTTVLSAVALLPLGFYSTYRMHQKRSRVDEGRTKIEEATAINHSSIRSMQELTHKLEALRTEYDELRREFSITFTQARQKAHEVAEGLASRANAFAEELDSLIKSKGASA